jgi:tetratricopeptide (TPR) repeat protein
VFGDKNEAVLADWIELGDELTELSRFDEAAVALRNALDLARELHGSVHSSVANILQELSASAGYAGRFDESEQLQRESLEMFEKVYGPLHHETLVARGNLLWAIEMRGKADEGLRGRLEMAELLERSDATRPELAASNMASIGVDYSKLGRLDDSEAALRRALALWRKIEGSNDEWDSADPMRQLADVLLWQGRYAEAEAEMRHAVAIEEKHEPPSSGWLNRDRAALAEMLRRQHRAADALSLSTAALAARGDVKPDPIQCMMLAQRSLAELDAGNADAAHEMAEAAVRMTAEVFPADSPKRAAELFVLARTDLATGRAKDAEPLLREAAALRSPPLPADDLRVLEVNVYRVVALASLGRADEARELRAAIEAPLKASKSPYATELIRLLDAPPPAQRAAA